MGYIDVGIVNHLVDCTKVGQQRRRSFMRDATRDTGAVVGGRIVAGKGHDRVHKEQLCGRHRTGAQPGQELCTINIGPVVRDLFEEEDRRVFFRLRVEEIVRFNGRPSVSEGQYEEPYTFKFDSSRFDGIRHSLVPVLHGGGT